MFKNVGIYVRQKSNHGVDLSAMDSMISFLANQNINLKTDKSSDYQNDLIEPINHEDLIKIVDLIIVFGGDGTLLNASRKYLDSEIPILGINMGNLGFLTDIKVENFEKSLSSIINGNYVIEERNLVSAEFNNNHIYGLNEVVIHSGSYAQLMRYRLTVNEKIVYEQRSDGLIIATPTGSTGYNLSSGGPIMLPETPSILITPIAAHNLNVRPLVIPNE